MQIHRYREVLRLIQQSGLTNHAIGNLLKMSPNTIQRCRQMAQQHGLEALATIDSAAGIKQSHQTTH